MRINPKKFTRAAVIVIILTAALALGIGYLSVILSGRSIVKNSVLEKQEKKLERFGKLYEMQDKIDKEFLFDHEDSEGIDAMAKALAGSLGDEFSEYMTAEELRDWEDAVNSAFTGIGITFNVTDGRAEILSVAEDGPADAADIRSGDVIRTVDDKEFTNEKEFIKAISGKPGKTLKLGMLRGWFPFDAEVTIGEVKVRAVTSRVIGEDTGYIRITTFSKDSSEEFAAELKTLTGKNVKSLVIDLRNNGGGYVDQGIKICDQILPECTIVYMENRNGKKKTYNSDEESCGLPLVVLINEKSASASEILAAAVKDNKAGKLVGMKTYGKGITQTEYGFSDGSALMLTTSQFFSPSGNAINGKGVKPDVKVRESKEDDDEDRQLKKAVALLK